MIISQAASIGLPPLVEVHVNPLTRDFLLSIYGNPARDKIIGSTPVLNHLFALGSNQISSMADEKNFKAPGKKKTLRLERPCLFETKPILRSSLLLFGDFLDDHANSIINRSLHCMMYTLKPGTAADQFIRIHDLDPEYLQRLKMRAYRMADEMQSEFAKNGKLYT